MAYIEVRSAGPPGYGIYLRLTRITPDDASGHRVGPDATELKGVNRFWWAAARVLIFHSLNRVRWFGVDLEFRVEFALAHPTAPGTTGGQRFLTPSCRPRIIHVSLDRDSCADKQKPGF